MVEREQVEKRVREALAGIMEHWEIAEILVSRVNDKDETESFVCGSGNWFARTGLVEHFLSKRDEDARVEFREQHEEES